MSCDELVYCWDDPTYLNGGGGPFTPPIYYAWQQIYERFQIVQSGDDVGITGFKSTLDIYHIATITVIPIFPIGSGGSSLDIGSTTIRTPALWVSCEWDATQCGWFGTTSENWNSPTSVDWAVELYARQYDRSTWGEPKVPYLGGKIWGADWDASQYLRIKSRLIPELTHGGMIPNDELEIERRWIGDPAGSPWFGTGCDWQDDLVLPEWMRGFPYRYHADLPDMGCDVGGYGMDLIASQDRCPAVPLYGFWGPDREGEGGAYPSQLPLSIRSTSSNENLDLSNCSVLTVGTDINTAGTFGYWAYKYQPEKGDVVDPYGDSVLSFYNQIWDNPGNPDLVPACVTPADTITVSMISWT